MAIKIWRGDYPGRSRVCKAVPSNVEPGDVFTLGVPTAADKSVSYTAQAASVADVVAGLVALWNASTIPELREIVAADVGGEYLTLTARTPGVPFEVTGTATDAGGFQVEVQTLQNGVANTNEKQQVTLPSATTGGTFVLNFAGQPTAAINWNDPATGIGSVQEKLEALSNIDPGDVIVTGSAGQWVVEFAGQYSGVNVPTMTGDGTNLTGAATIAVKTTTDGRPGKNAIYRVQHAGNSCAARVSFQAGGTGGTSDPFYHPSQWTQALTEIISGGWTTRSVSATETEIEFIGPYGSQEVSFSVVDAHVPAGISSSPVQGGSSTGANETQTITLKDGPKAGTWTATFQGQTATGLAFDIDAATLQTQLEGLSNVGAGNVIVTKTGTLPNAVVYTVEFQGTLANLDLQQMSASAAGLTGGNVYCDTIQSAVQGKDEVQRISFSQTPSGGTWDLTIDLGAGAETVLAIAYNATAAALETGLEGLPSIAPGDVEVTGDAGGPWTVGFLQNLARQNLNQFTGDGSGLTGAGGQSLTVTVEVSSTGPNHVDEPANYQPFGLPVNGDELFVEDGRSSLLYGLDALDGIPITYHQSSRFGGTVGLPHRNEAGYVEYRRTDLKLTTTKIVIGYGDGAGSQRTQLEIDGTATVDVLQTGGSPEAGVPALLLKGGTLELLVIEGDVGVGFRPGETSIVSLLKQRGGVVTLGAITLNALDKTGGELVAEQATIDGAVSIRG